MSEPPARWPRGTQLPTQSPLFWVADKDRYLRQLLLQDLSQRFGRRQLVYFTRCDTTAQIDLDDDKLLLELLSDVGDEPLDLHLETNGGFTDAAEKLLAILEPYRPRLRVIVPRRAKSNGTLLALAASEIIMGCGSELGPIDPSVQIGTHAIPAHFVLQAKEGDPIVKQIAAHAMKQTQSLAERLLRTGQLSSNVAAVDGIVKRLSTRDAYPSHGSVIDAAEVKSLGLRVAEWTSESEDWKWVWLLRCLYESDARRANVVKIFEGTRLSNSIRPLSA